MHWTHAADLADADDARPLSLAYPHCCLCGVADAVPLAVGEEFDSRTRRDTFMPMRCRRCGLIFLNPRPTRDELARIYPPSYHAFQFSEDDFGLAHRVRSRLEAR